jgi:hypothetical protein
MPDRRHEPRVQVNGEVTIKIQSAPEAPDLEGQIFLSNLTNVSFDGLQMYLDYDIPIGALLVLEIVFANSSEKYCQIGKVMWKNESTDSRMEQQSSYRVGIMFEESDDQQHDAWTSEVINLLAKTKLI